MITFCPNSPRVSSWGRKCLFEDAAGTACRWSGEQIQKMHSRALVIKLRPTRRTICSCSDGLIVVKWKANSKVQSEVYLWPEDERRSNLLKIKTAKSLKVRKKRKFLRSLETPRNAVPNASFPGMMPSSLLLSAPLHFVQQYKKNLQLHRKKTATYRFRSHCGDRERLPARLWVLNEQ